MAKTSLPFSKTQNKICSVDGCVREHKAKGFCGKHYQTFRAFGDPLGAAPLRSIQDIFWSHVDKTPGLGPKGECWEWTGSKQDGYGRASVRGIGIVLTHRLSFFFENGRWPEPCGLHTCDNPPCVRPSHIYEGTKQDNADDKVKRNRCRNPVGSQVVISKLTENDIPVVRQLLADGLSQDVVAKRFGVSQVAISQIALGKTWRHVQ